MSGKASRARRRARDCARAAFLPVASDFALEEEIAAIERFAREVARGKRYGCTPRGERAHRVVVEVKPAPFEGRLTASFADVLRARP
jgi:hypothetical protein